MNRVPFAVAAVGLSLAILPPSASVAQLIPIKTVPVAAGDQFLVFPAENLGLGGLGLAVPDAFLDPFVNPAKGSRLEGTRLLGSPTFYSISEQNGAGRTLPLTLLHGSSDWFMGASIALQQLQSDDGDIFAPRPFFGETLLRDRSATNTYVFGLLGRTLPGRAVSVAASFRWAGLSEVDGVDLLYAGADRVEQSGSRADVRVGLLAEAEDGRAFEAVGVFNEIDMTHEVSYAEWFWGRPVPEGIDPIVPVPEPTRRLETNLDHTRTWGVHLGYVQPIRDTGWRFGAGLTGNKKSHPKIPNYDIQNIPRDPGDSWAYNFGLALAKIEGPLTYGVEFVFEPIWSNTWQEADRRIVTRSGITIPVGGKTIENDFDFTNARFRMGVGRDIGASGIQLGLEARSYSYTLVQFDNVASSRRIENEDWMEWVPTWGTRMVFPEVELRYSGRLTTGTGRPGVGFGFDDRAMEDAAAAPGDFLVAAAGPLTLQDVRVMTHQLTVAIPIR